MPFLSRGLRARLAVSLVLAMLATLLVVPGVLAHEHRTVGDYEIVIGFLNEPAIVEEPNGLDLRVSRGSGEEAEPVEGLADTLQAEVIYGGETMPLELRPAFGQPGAYRSNFIPTAEGAYTFHITGEIEGMAIDETFTSGPDTFSEVASRAALTFPEEVAAVGVVAAEVSDAADSADSARTLALVALVVAVLGLLAGVTALVLARRGAARESAA